MIVGAYITAAAVRHWLSIQGAAENDATFDQAAKQLQELLAKARLAKDIGPGQRSQQWRVSTDVRGRRQRLELIVAVEPRPEGPQPQLIAVRLKGRAGR